MHIISQFFTGRRLSPTHKERQTHAVHSTTDPYDCLAETRSLSTCGKGNQDGGISNDAAMSVMQESVDRSRKVKVQHVISYEFLQRRVLLEGQPICNYCSTHHKGLVLENLTQSGVKPEKKAR